MSAAPKTVKKPSEKIDDEDVSIALDYFEPDRICTRCGFWRSEHDWEICQDPNYVESK